MENGEFSHGFAVKASLPETWPTLIGKWDWFGLKYLHTLAQVPTETGPVLSS